MQKKNFMKFVNLHCFTNKNITIFDKIIKKEINSTIYYEDEYVLILILGFGF